MHMYNYFCVYFVHVHVYNVHVTVLNIYSMYSKYMYMYCTCIMLVFFACHKFISDTVLLINLFLVLFNV